MPRNLRRYEQARDLPFTCPGHPADYRLREPRKTFRFTVSTTFQPRPRGPLV